MPPKDYILGEISQQPVNRAKPSGGIIKNINVTIERVYGRVPVELKDANNATIGQSATTPIFVQNVGSGGGTPTADVNVLDSVLPDGAATEVTLAAINTKITTCNTGAIAGTVAVSNPTADPETGLAKDLTLTNGSQHTVVDSGSITVNVVDVSALAKESGGHLEEAAYHLHNIEAALTNPLPVSATHLDIRHLNSTDDTVTVTGTVTVDTSLLATKAIQTDKSQFTKITDGTETWSIDSNNYGEVSIKASPASGIPVKAPAGDKVATGLSDGTNTATIKRADAAGAVGTYVQPVQHIDATGKIQPAGEVYTNPVFAANRLIDEAGAAYGVKHIQNKPRVSTMPYLYDITEGNITGHTAWSKTGFNDNLATTYETMWTNSTLYSFPTVAGQMEVVSSDNTQDKAGGTGALTVRVGYLKSDYSESSVTLTLNGTTAVPTGAGHADIWRINSFRVMTTGTGLAPLGNLTLRIAGGGATHGYIRAGFTRARSCFYTVPLGKILYITSISFSVVGTKFVTFTTRANYENISATILQRGLYMPYSEVALFNAPYAKTLEAPTRLPATVDLKVDVIAEANGSTATCHLRGWLET